MSAFDALLKTVKVGQLISLAICTIYNDSELNTGFLKEIFSDGCIIESNNELIYIASNNIVSWKVTKDNPSSTNSRQKIDDSNIDKELSRGESDNQLSASKKSESFSPESLRIFCDKPEWSCPKPSFNMNEMPAELGREIDRWKNRYEYAQKVREPFRLAQDVHNIEGYAKSFNSSILFFLAGIFAHIGGNPYDKARQYYEKALEYGFQPAVNALISLTIENSDWERATAYLLSMIFNNGYVDKDSVLIVKTLGQCILRTADQNIEGIEKIISCGLHGDASILALSLYQIIMSIREGTNQIKIEQDKFESPHLNNNETKNTKENTVKKNCKTTVKLSSFSELPKIMFPEMEEENKLTVPAIGNIQTYFRNNEFGFITDKNGYDIYFCHNDIIDETLSSMLNDAKKVKISIPVIYTPSNNYKGKKATNIQKPTRVEELIQKAKNVADVNPKRSRAIVEQILSAFPENFSAKNLIKEINDKIDNIGSNYSQIKRNISDYPNYKKATRSKNIDKDYDEALKYYMIALQNNEKRESCVKDIAMLYISMSEETKALEFIKEHENVLINCISTYYFLESIYSSAKDFGKALEYLNLLLKENSVKSDNRKHSLYLSKKGFALIQLADFEEARKILEKAVMIQPLNTYACRLLEALNEPNNEGLDELIADAEFDTFGGGLSKLIKDIIEKYDDYFGVPAKIIDAGDFTNETLNSIRRLIETAGKARPRERANYLLTEVKLMQLLEPDKDVLIRSVLARYCNAMALNHISENSPMDVIRNYYLEAFSLEEKFSNTAPQVALYLISYKSSYSDLLAAKTPSIDEVLKIVFENDIKDSIWEGILSVFLWNRSISAQIISKLYNNKIYKEKSIIFLKNIGINTQNNLGVDEYTNIWNQARDRRQRDCSRWLAAIKAIYANESLETLVDQLFVSLNDARRSWLTQIDTSRLSTISTEILDVLSQYLRQSCYRDKERYSGIAKEQVKQLITAINEKPTKLSYEGFVPILEKINYLLEKSFKNVEEASTPKVKVNILGDASVVSNDNMVPFQVTVENSKDSSPIRDIKIEVENNAEILFIEENNEFCEFVDGGENCILRLAVKVSEKVKYDKATTLNVTCRYKTRTQDEPAYIKEELSLRLYSEEEFEKIENPYAPIADGGPVEDKNMFYGRDEFIENRIKAILNADSKQIIIYGQKRSGKSSVLYHLKQGLEKTNQTFCISFSLGLIVKDLNEFTFYHKILSVIERELKLRKAKKEHVPTFVCPSLEEFRNKYFSNPANGFIEFLEDFRIACLDVEGWSDKKLVVMIDEFTYLYTAIKNGTTSNTIMKQWKAITQSGNAKISVVLVGQDVVPSFKQEDYAKNAFGVIEDIRLTYLEEEDARRLIQEPIQDRNGNSRFIGRAVDAIIDYSSRNPYYIQIFCARLVDYMNSKKIMRVTEADIKEVATTFIDGSQALAPEKFDNLIRAGEEHDFREFDDEPIIKILRQIAYGSKSIGICARDNISLNDKKLEDRILNHLVDREILEHKQGDNYKIQVRLFKEWLLKH